MPHIKIYYYCHTKASITQIGWIALGKVTIDDIDKYYECIYSFDTEIKEQFIEEFLENMFRRFNSEENPLSAPEYQKRIRDIKAHTSMNTGDIIQIDDDYYVVSGWGFTKLN